MSSYRINNKNYPWPDEGESNWGETVTDFVFALTNAVNDLFSKAVLNNSDQTITGQKTFSTLPKVSISTQSGSAPTPFNLVYSQQPTNIDTLVTDLQSKLDQIRVFIDPNSDSTILTDDVAESILALSQQNTHSIKNYLEGIIKLTNQLTPLGSIKATYGQLENSALANWIPAIESDPEAIFIEQSTIDNKHFNIYNQRIINGETQGFYKPTGGNWALCDERFPLPLRFGNTGVSSFGSIFYQNHKFIPNLNNDVFLKGSSFVQDISVTGTNSTILEVDQLPTHSHSVSHTTQTSTDGSHTHVYSRRDINVLNAQSVDGDDGDNYFIRTLEAPPRDNNTNPSGEHSHSVTLDFITHETGVNKPIDKTPKNFPVNYYMRIF